MRPAIAAQTVTTESPQGISTYDNKQRNADFSISVPIDAPTGIAPIFDADTVQKEIDAQVRITQTFGQHASKAIGDYAKSRLKEAGQQQMAGLVKQQQANRARKEGQFAQADALQAEADTALGIAADLRQQWGEQGIARLALHTLTGALTGAEQVKIVVA